MPIIDALDRLADADREAVEHLLETSAPAAIRINPLKAEVAHVQKWADRYGWQIRPVPFCSDGWQISAGEILPSRTLEFRMGQYYVQDAASMLPVGLAGVPHDQPFILDLCAAPGGKSTHLVSTTEDRGMLVANDISAKRLPALIANLAVWGATHTAVTSLPGEQIGGLLPDHFDVVLLDAPCSGESLRFSRERRTVSDTERQALVERQVRLLESALRAVKPGGQVIYATCTAAPEENEGVIDAVLKRYSDAVGLADAFLLNIPAAKGLDLYDNLALTRCVRLWPHLFDTEAFFSAVLEKHHRLASGASATELPAGANLLQPLAEREIGAVTAAFEGLGCDLPGLLEHHGLSIRRRREHLYAVPDALETHLPDLPVQHSGLLMAREASGGNIPTVEFVSRFEPFFTAPRLEVEPNELNIWLRGGDLRREAGFASRSLVIVQDTDGRFAGLGKVSARRVRNLLPAHWFTNASAIIA